MTRTLVVITGYLVLGVALHFQQPAPPSPIKLVPVTEAQIKEGVKHERKTREIAKAIAAARLVYRRNHISDKYAEITGKTAVEVGVSSRLLAAVITVESGGNPNAVSGRDSIGLMQVNPRVWGHRKELKDPARNLQIGARILAGYIARYGMVEGLHHYNGYSEVHGHEYVNKVLTTAQIVVM